MSKTSPTKDAGICRYTPLIRCTKQPEGDFLAIRCEICQVKLQHIEKLYAEEPAKRKEFTTRW